MIAREPHQAELAEASTGSPFIIRLTGAVGQGASLLGDLLAEAAATDGWHVAVGEDLHLWARTTPAAVQTVVALQGWSQRLAPGPETPADLVIEFADLPASQVSERLPTPTAVLKPEGRWLRVRTAGTAGPIGQLHTTAARQTAELVLAPQSLLSAACRQAVILGLVSGWCPVSPDRWQPALESHLPARRHAEAWEAFRYGAEVGRSLASN